MGGQCGKSITEKGLKESSTSILHPGDLIVSARGTVGALAMVSRDMAFNQSCYGLRAKKDLISIIRIISSKEQLIS
ncbi:restriction endonuclease subunit S [Allobaculum sp. Allo2]|uniref:restriction endonuclease subunit S n=1 Tax=Allobaculum sp. Allo2 TaxID=2853432 RepID=UPI003463473B|nr:restriction endonuclease subunit S [Allobaculum sp. Allo2]